MAKESFMEDFTELVNGVSFSSDAKKDAFISNVKFFRYKADTKIRQNPSDEMNVEKGFLNQVNTLVKKLENEKTVLKSGADTIRSGIGYILRGEKPEVTKKVQIPTSVKKAESVEVPVQETVVEETVSTPEPEVVKEKPVVEKPHVEPKPVEEPIIDQVVKEAMKNCESIVIDHANDTKPNPGESQEDFQKRMDAFVNDPVVLGSAKPVDVENVKPENHSKTGEKVESNNSGTVEQTSERKEESSTESTETKDEEEIKSSKEDPVEQGSFQTQESSEPESFEENDDPYDQAFVDHISFDQEPLEDETVQEENVEPESEEETVDEEIPDEESQSEEYEEYYEEEEPKKTGKEKLKDAAKLAATIVIPLTIGFTMGYALGKNSPQKTENSPVTSSELVRSRFCKKR